MSYLRWKTSYEEGHAVILPPEGIDDDWQLLEGVSRAKGFPDGVTCRMSPDYPKDLELADSLHGADLIVVSGRVKQLIESEGAEQVEFLPVEILNHKKRSASKDYFIVNPIDPVDCIDMERSGPEWNPIDKESLSGCESLVLKPNSVPAARKVFRMKHWPAEILVPDAFAEKLKNAGFTGLEFREAEGWTGVG